MVLTKYKLEQERPSLKSVFVLEVILGRRQSKTKLHQSSLAGSSPCRTGLPKLEPKQFKGAR